MEYHTLGASEITDSPDKYIPSLTIRFNKFGEEGSINNAIEFMRRYIERLKEIIRSNKYSEVEAWYVVRTNAQAQAYIILLGKLYPNVAANYPEKYAQLSEKTKELELYMSKLPAQATKASPTHALENTALMKAIGLPTIGTGVTILPQEVPLIKKAYSEGKPYFSREPEKSNLPILTIGLVAVAGFLAYKNLM